jgi:hypothetical protein
MADGDAIDDISAEEGDDERSEGSGKLYLIVQYIIKQ